MKTAKVTLNYDFEGMKEIRIENEMAPLSVWPSTTQSITIEAEISVHEHDTELDLADAINVNYEDGTVEIELEEVAGSNFGFRSGKSYVKILVPAGVDVSAECENLPVSFHGLDCALKVESDNAPVAIDQCNGPKKLENENGPTKIHACTGDLSVSLENGPLAASKLSGSILNVKSENGPVKMSSCCFSKVDITNENGVVYYETLPLEDGDLNFANENGVVHLLLPEDLDFTLDATTEWGTLTGAFEVVHDANEGSYHVQRGEGKVRIRVKTENGSIKLGSDAHLNLGYVKIKLAELKDRLSSLKDNADTQQLLILVNSVTEYISKALDKIPEEKIKANIKVSLEKLKASLEGINVQEISQEALKKVQDLTDEVYEGLKSVFRKVGGPFREHDRHDRPRAHHEMNSMRDYINRMLDTAFSGRGLNRQDKHEVDERSRLKILEMLESGKISAEEAERLLKAIGKE
jgi:ribosomal protein L6P/L9E